MTFMLENTKLWWCLWDIPIAILLLVIVVIFLVKHRNMKKEQNELKDRLKELHREDTHKKRLPPEERW